MPFLSGSTIDIMRLMLPLKPPMDSNVYCYTGSRNAKLKLDDLTAGKVRAGFRVHLSRHLSLCSLRVRFLLPGYRCMS